MLSFQLITNTFILEYVTLDLAWDLLKPFPGTYSQSNSVMGADDGTAVTGGDSSQAAQTCTEVIIIAGVKQTVFTSEYLC